jgi:hypothetical protein
MVLGGITDSGNRGREAHVKSSGYWIDAIIGVVIVVAGVLIHSSHHTIGLAAIILGVLLVIIGIVMALRAGRSSKAA